MMHCLDVLEEHFLVTQRHNSHLKLLPFISRTDLTYLIIHCLNVVEYVSLRTIGTQLPFYLFSPILSCIDFML